MKIMCIKKNCASNNSRRINIETKILFSSQKCVLKSIFTQNTQFRITNKQQQQPEVISWTSHNRVIFICKL